MRKITQWAEPPTTMRLPKQSGVMDYSKLSDEQVADGMRMVKLVGDLEYTEVNPDIARARLARQNNEAKKTLRVDPKDPSKSYDPDLYIAAALPALPLTAAFAQQTSLPPQDKSRLRERERFISFLPPLNEPRSVFGSDDRVWVDSIGQTMARPIVKLVFGSNFAGNYAGSCSGTMIGNWTAMSAGHCFFDTDTMSWYGTKSWAIDTIKWRAAGSSGAYTTQTFYPSGSYQIGCITPTLTIAYVNGTYLPNDAAEDMAVIEFGCGYYPGYTTGYWPVGIGTDAQIGASATYINGYDSTAPLPYSIQAGWDYAPGSMLKREGPFFSMWPYSAGSQIIETQLDTTGGSSGAGFIKNLFWWSHGDASLYWSGVNAIENGATNFGRRADWGLWYFVQNASTEF